MNPDTIHYIIEASIAFLGTLYIWRLTRQSDTTDKGIEDAKLIATRLAVVESKIDAEEAKAALVKITTLESKVAVVESRITNETSLLEKLEFKLDRLLEK